MHPYYWFYATATNTGKSQKRQKRLKTKMPIAMSYKAHLNALHVHMYSR